MTIGDRIATWALAALLGGLRLLPMAAASALMGGIARILGPPLGISRRARARLERALPGLGEAEYRRIIRGMWDNLGRVFGEYAHLDRISCVGMGAQVELVGTEHVDAALARGRPLLFVSGHCGNWEVGYIAARQYGLDVAPVYRAVNNPGVEALMLGVRRSTGVEPIAKGAAGARRIIAAMKRNAALTLLVDQKMNDGIPVPFFGRDAMTAPAAAELALRHEASLLPARVERLRGVAFRVTVYPPLELERSGDRHADAARIMLAINRRLEQWITERPDQWFWLHRRWKED